MMSAQLVVIIALIWQLVSTTKVHLQASSRKYVKETIYRCIKFGTDIDFTVWYNTCCPVKSIIWNENK